jgi:hypothetical protein
MLALQSIFKKRSLRVTICGKTSRRIKQIARGEDVSKNINYNDKSVRKNMKRDLPSSGKGGKGGHGKGGDGPDRKKFRPAYMARSENDNETDANKKNANKRINLKVRMLLNTTLHYPSFSCSQTPSLSLYPSLSYPCACPCRTVS